MQYWNVLRSVLWTSLKRGRGDSRNATLPGKEQNQEECAIDIEVYIIRRLYVLYICLLRYLAAVLAGFTDNFTEPLHSLIRVFVIQNTERCSHIRRTSTIREEGRPRQGEDTTLESLG